MAFPDSYFITIVYKSEENMVIHSYDNVEVNLENGHKYALRDIAKGEDIIKYGNPIGHATADIKKASTFIRTTLRPILRARYAMSFRAIFRP